MDIIHDDLNKYITYGIIYNILCTCAVTASYT